MKDGLSSGSVFWYFPAGAGSSLSAGRRILVHVPATVPNTRPSLWSSGLVQLCHLACIRRAFRVALPLGGQELRQGLWALHLPWPELDPGPAAVRLFTPTLSSHLHHDTPAHSVPDGSDGLARGPGSGVPRVCLQWRQLLQTHALPGHGHLLYDHPYLLHPIPDEGEKVVCTQLL